MYIAGILVCALIGVVILFWERIGLDTEFFFNTRAMRITVGVMILLFAGAGIVDLLLNWNAVSAGGRIHWH